MSTDSTTHTDMCVGMRVVFRATRLSDIRLAHGVRVFILSAPLDYHRQSRWIYPLERFFARDEGELDDAPLEPAQHPESGHGSLHWGVGG